MATKYHLNRMQLHSTFFYYYYVVNLHWLLHTGIEADSWKWNYYLCVAVHLWVNGNAENWWKSLLFDVSIEINIKMFFSIAGWFLDSRTQKDEMKSIISVFFFDVKVFTFKCFQLTWKHEFYLLSPPFLIHQLNKY